MAFGSLVKSDPIILGSGELYLGTIENIEEAEEETIAAALENIGAIESGASVKYTPTTKVIESANRGIIAKFISKEEVTFNCGIMTWKLENLERLCPATVTKDVSKNTKTLKIGKQGSLPVNYLRFVHTKADGKTLTVNIYKAVAEGGFELNFDAENPMSINHEFTALAKTDGTLIEIVEEFESVGE